MQIIRKSDLKTSTWSGGTTTQLFIFPFSATYSEMNFDFRISKATIETEESTFTPLPGVHRTLMVLKGALELRHQNHHHSKLQPFEKDSFLGDWTTHSKGLAEDFNLMVKDPNLKGDVQHLFLEKSTHQNLSTDKHGFLHIYQGSIEINHQTHLTTGDSLYFTDTEKVTVTASERTDLILTLVQDKIEII